VHSKPVSIRAAPLYADFAVFGPFGRQTAKLRQYEVKKLVGNKIISRLVRGPGSYEQWLGSWNIYKTCMIMCDAACPGGLDAYQVGIFHLTVFFPTSWSDIALAGVNMRYDYWQRIHEDMNPANLPVEYDTKKPWDWIIMQCAYGEATLKGAHWWEMHLVKALISPQSTQSVIARLEGRSVQQRPPLAAMDDEGDERISKRARGNGAGRGSDKRAGKGVCNDFNLGRCKNQVCPRGYTHSCSFCGKAGHGAKACRANPANAETPLVKPVRDKRKGGKGQYKR
jgi:hypothetical protein